MSGSPACSSRRTGSSPAGTGCPRLPRPPPAGPRPLPLWPCFLRSVLVGHGHAQVLPRGRAGGHQVMRGEPEERAEDEHAGEDVRPGPEVDHGYRLFASRVTVTSGTLKAVTDGVRPGRHGLSGDHTPTGQVSGSASSCATFRCASTPDWIALADVG